MKLATRDDAPIRIKTLRNVSTVYKITNLNIGETHYNCATVSIQKRWEFL